MCWRASGRALSHADSRCCSDGGSTCSLVSTIDRATVVGVPQDDADRHYRSWSRYFGEWFDLVDSSKLLEVSGATTRTYCCYTACCCSNVIPNLSCELAAWTLGDWQNYERASFLWITLRHLDRTVYPSTVWRQPDRPPLGRCPGQGMW